MDKRLSDRYTPAPFLPKVMGAMVRPKRLPNYKYYFFLSRESLLEAFVDAEVGFATMYNNSSAAVFSYNDFRNLEGVHSIA